MASDKVVQLTDENFEQQVLQSDRPALVDFWAEWCMPCKMIAATIDELAGEYQDQVVVGKVNTDESRQVPRNFGISAIPTLMVFKDGQVVKKLVGMQSKQQIKAVLDEVLGR